MRYEVQDELAADVMLQNAMSVAEITDKLGLHSLRQRVWVRLLFFPPFALSHNPADADCAAVHPIDLRHLG